MKIGTFDTSPFFCGIVVAAAASSVHHDGSHLALRSTHAGSSSLVQHKGLELFGDTSCPCIGFNGIDGETTVVLGDDTQVDFPADLGARCEKWDNGVHPDCKEGETPGLGNDWCGQAWCFVDACNCNTPVLPKTSVYVPDARYRGRPVFYSYATCGGADLIAKELPEDGATSCRCIGFDNIPGTTEITIGDKNVDYPAEIGGSCKAWDWDVHPLCQQGTASPPWCKARWCYVDPCSCSLDASPKVTMYLPESSFTGKALYYSYETCGAKDTFTNTHNREACVNQDSKEACLEVKWDSGVAKCGWAGRKCLGAELVGHPLCKEVVAGEVGHRGGRTGEKSDAAGLARLACPTMSLAAIAVVAWAH